MSDSTGGSVKHRHNTNQQAVQDALDGPVSQRHRFALWMTLILMLAVLALAASAGAYLLASEGNDFAAALFGLATASVGGLIGVFSTSPTKKE